MFSSARSKMGENPFIDGCLSRLIRLVDVSINYHFNWNHLKYIF